MIKLFDFAYYYIYQLNRKGYKNNHHEYARGFLAMMLSTWGGISIIFFELFISKIFKTNGIYLTFLIGVPIYSVVYWLTGKMYGVNGSKSNIVKEYDKKYSLKKQNRYYQVFVIWFLTMLWMAFCVIMRFKVKKWIGL